MDRKDIKTLELYLQRLKLKETLTPEERTILKTKTTALHAFCLDNRPTYIERIELVKPPVLGTLLGSVKFRNYLCTLLGAYHKK